MSSSVLNAMYVYYVISAILYNVSLLNNIMYSNVLQLGSSSEVQGLHSWFQLQRQDHQPCVQYAMLNHSMSYIESKKYKCRKTHTGDICIISSAIPRRAMKKQLMAIQSFSAPKRPGRGDGV